MKPRNSGKSSFQIFRSFLCFPAILPITSSDHAFRPRLPTTLPGHAFTATPFSHVFRPRLPTCQSNRGTSAGAQRPRTRAVQMIVRVPPMPSSRTAASSCVASVGKHSLDSESAHVDCHLYIQCDSVLVNSWNCRPRCAAPTTVNPCYARTKLLHALTSSWWHRIQTCTAASWITSGLTGSARAQVMDSSIFALVGFGDSGNGSKLRTSSFREKVLHLLNISFTATLPPRLFEWTSKDGSSPQPT